jgi:pimeloyl-ACP methyl ester carboxylesterase
MMRGRLAGLAAVLLAAAIVAGCGPFRGLRRDLARMDAGCVVRGQLTGVIPNQGEVVVAVLRRPAPDLIEIADVAVLEPRDQRFVFFLPYAADYLVTAVQDLDGDQRRDDGEPAWVYGAPDFVPFDADRRSPVFDARLDPATPRPPPELQAAFAHARAGRAFVALGTGHEIPVGLGEIADLDAPRFSAQAGHEGLWQPVTFLAQNGTGVFFVEPYDAGRLPVLFVNGADGSPQDFRYFYEQLDRSRYQAWFFLYPSGLALAESSRMLGLSIDDLHERLGFERFAIVAHSMGGLVARAFLAAHVAAKKPPRPVAFATLSSPWLGHEAAALGVEYAPAVIPSWRDMQTNSPFTQALYTTSLGAELAYCLGFTYRGKSGIGLPQNNDGAVSIASQLAAPAQAEAVAIRGFDETHRTVLHSAASVAFVHECLAREPKENP